MQAIQVQPPDSAWKNINTAVRYHALRQRLYSSQGRAESHKSVDSDACTMVSTSMSSSRQVNERDDDNE